MGLRSRMLHAGLWIMMRLSIFKSKMNETYQEDNDYNIPHVTKVLKELVLPWDNICMIV